jgi:hypothetical protein
MKRTLLFCLAIFVWTLPVFAWHTNTHLQMTRDALALMPADFQKIFTEHLQYTEAGIKDPDEVIKDWANHYYIPAIPEGGALDRIDKLVAIVQTKLKNGSSFDASRQLCYVAHYIGDLWTPEDLIKQSTASDRDFISNSDIVVAFDGFNGPIENIHDYLKARSEWRWKLQNTKDVETLLYSEAVNDIARVWLTIWQKSGNTVHEMSASLMEHRHKAIDVNFERLLLEEKYSGSTWQENYYESSNNSMDAYDAQKKEIERLSANVNPTSEQLIASFQVRNDQQMLSKMALDAPFKMLETSLRTIGDKTFFVARVRNRAKDPIASIAFMYPGVRGAAALVKDLQPGHVSKIEAVLPANATKDQLQVIFSSPTQQQ